jgi:hypothetical protein
MDGLARLLHAARRRRDRIGLLVALVLVWLVSWELAVIAG